MKSRTEKIRWLWAVFALYLIVRFLFAGMTWLFNYNIAFVGNRLVYRVRLDLHCHSTASQLSRLGVQRSLGLPECATPPEEVYELAKRRGMDFVTITDHDTIDGCLELADRPDCFVSEELTARFAGEPQAVHVLCYGITPGDHE